MESVYWIQDQVHRTWCSGGSMYWIQDQGHPYMAIHRSIYWIQTQSRPYMAIHGVCMLISESITPLHGVPWDLYIEFWTNDAFTWRSIGVYAYVATDKISNCRVSWMWKDHTGAIQTGYTTTRKWHTVERKAWVRFLAAGGVHVHNNSAAQALPYLMRTGNTFPKEKRTEREHNHTSPSNA